MTSQLHLVVALSTPHYVVNLALLKQMTVCHVLMGSSIVSTLRNSTVKQSRQRTKVLKVNISRSLNYAQPRYAPCYNRPEHNFPFPVGFVPRMG